MIRISTAIEEFEERAAIMEFDGGLARVEAEKAALAEQVAKASWLRVAIQEHLAKGKK
jgi:hypothetical protein